MYWRAQIAKHHSIESNNLCSSMKVPSRTILTITRAHMVEIPPEFWLRWKADVAALKSWNSRDFSFITPRSVLEITK